MTIVVDHAKCAGHGICEALAPEVFAVGVNGKSVVHGQPGNGTEQEAVREAISCCPAEAISA